MHIINLNPFFFLRINLLIFYKILTNINRKINYSFFFIESSKLLEFLFFLLKLLKVNFSLSKIEEYLGDYTDKKKNNIFVLKNQILVKNMKKNQQLFNTLKLYEHKYKKSQIIFFLERKISSDNQLKLGRFLQLYFFSKTVKTLDKLIFVERFIYNNFLDSNFEKKIIQPITHFKFELLFNILRLIKFNLICFTSLFEFWRNRIKHKKVALQYKFGANPVKGNVSDFDIIKESKIQSHNIIYYYYNRYDYTTKSYPKDHLKETRNKCFKFLGIESWRPKFTLIDLFLINKNFCQNIMSIVLMKDLQRQQKILFINCLIRFLTLYYKFYNFYKEFNIITDIHWGDSNLDLAPKVFAIENQGGIDTRFQFSWTGFNNPGHSTFLYQNLYLQYGPHEMNMIQECNKTLIRKAKLYLDIGTLRGEQLKYLNIKIKKNLEAFRHKKYKNVAVFDVIFNKDKLNSLKNYNEFYDVINEVSLKFKNFKFIIKPQSVIPQEILKKISLNKNFLILSPQIKTLSLFPYIDFAIGQNCYNSAVLEALAFKIPAFFYDNCNHSIHPNLKLAPKDLIINDKNILIKQLSKLQKNHNSFDKLISSFSNSLDPFKDDKAYVRFGFVIDTINEYKNNFSDSEKFLNLLAIKYGKKFGNKNVHWGDKKCAEF